MKDEDKYVRRNSAWALGEIRPEAKQAVPALTVDLNDQDADIRKYTADTIQKINSKIEAQTTEETDFDF